VKHSVQKAEALTIGGARGADLLQQNISRFAKFGAARNSFDCASLHAVRSGRWAFRIDAMLEAVTAFFGIMSAGIFIAHAVDGYRSRL
jgi:hypothetical protein